MNFKNDVKQFLMSGAKYGDGVCFDNSFGATELINQLKGQKRRRTKKTRWDFESLNKENEQINQMALKAFDPVRCIPKMRVEPYDPSLERDIGTAITAPHRITDKPVATQLRRKTTFANDSLSVNSHDMRETINHLSQSRVINKTSSRNMTDSYSRTSQSRYTGSTDLDETIDKFVDKIDEFGKW